MEVLKVDEWLINRGFERINEISVRRIKDNKVFFLQELVYNNTIKFKCSTSTLTQIVLHFCSNNKDVLLQQERTTIYIDGDGGSGSRRSTRIIKKHINDI